jgi:predicted ArsR family transcriptional regulator
VVVADELDERLASVGVLAEPVRRALYRYVVAQPDAVSREQAAEAVALPRHTVKFHLDRLVDGGLLDVEFRRLTGRSGPGAGRPAKLYRRADHDVSVSLPERRYDLVGEVLAEAVDRAISGEVEVADALRDVAHDQGVELAQRFVREHATTAAADSIEPCARTAALLSEQGYEPRTTEGELALTNCPFDRLAKQHTELVCGVNLALIEGVVEGLEATGLTPELAPRPDFCCVRILT